MVPLVFILFILYISAYMGTMTASSEKVENFTISDVLQFPPHVHLVNHLEAMAQKALLQKPNQFLEKAIIEVPNQFILPESSEPERPERILEPKSFELKRGPSLTFVDGGPTVIQTPKVSKTTPSSISQLWTTTTPQVPMQTWSNPATEEGNAFLASIADPTQAQLEADYMEERLVFHDEDFDINDNDIYMDKNNQGILTLKNNQKMGSHMLLTPDSEQFNLEDLARPKKSTIPGFDTLLGSFRPDTKSDKVGYAQVVHHDHIPSYEPPGTPLPSYQASASSSKEYSKFLFSLAETSS